MARTYWLFLVGLVVSISTGCATKKEAIPPHLTIVDLPALNQKNAADIGETLVQKGKVYTYDGVRLENSISAGDGFFLKKFSLEPGLLKATMRDKSRLYYTTDKLAVYDAMLGVQFNFGGLAVSRTNSSDAKFHWNGRIALKPKPDPILTPIQVNDLERPSFRQELIYNGRSGDTLKFLYREFSNDLMRAPFSQEVQYDLKDGNIVGFKSVRLEVLEATNTRLKYRIISSFPDLP